MTADTTSTDGFDWRARAEDCWRLLGVGLLITGVFVVSLRLRLVLLPLLAGAMVAVLAVPLSDRLRRLSVPPAPAAILSVATLLLLALGTLTVAVAVLVNDTDQIGDRLGETNDLVADWLTDGPVGLSQEEVEDYRTQIADQGHQWTTDWLESGGALSGTTTVLEVLAGMILALVIAFFLVKDRDVLGERALQRFHGERRIRVARTAGAIVGGLRGYLRGVVILGTVEGITIGSTVAVLASPTYGLPVAIFTFMAAFFPVVGAIVAGMLAIAVTLAVAGPIPAVIVAAVAILVQQLDSDLLAPLVYGRMIRIHPLGILIALTAGSVLAGVAGAFVAVPLTAMTIAGLRAWAETAPQAEAVTPATDGPDPEPG